MQPELPAKPSYPGRRRPIGRALALLLLAAAGASLAGCTGAPSQNRQVLRRTQPPQPILTDTAVFAGGSLTAECTLGPTVRLKRAARNADAGDPTGPGRHARPETNAGTLLHPERAEEAFAQGGSEYSPQEIDEMYGRKDYESVLPPRSALVLRFSNTGPKPVTFTIADVNSTLGDFATRPEILTVAAGQLGAVDPMLSNMESNFEALDVTVTLKIDGKAETHVLKLHRSSEPPRPE